MQFRNRLVCSQQKFVNDFIHFKISIPNIVEIVEYYLRNFLIFKGS